MRTLSPAALAVSLPLWVAPIPATAGNLRPFATPTERLVATAREARLHGELAQAAAILDHAEAGLRHPDARVLHERGLLARDRGAPAEAIAPLERSADLDSASDARVDLAGILVGLGRWPEAVVVLEKAFAERGSSLDVDTVTSDPRFAPLATLAPYTALIDRIREEQAGPIGKLRLRLEKIEEAARNLEDVLRRLGRLIGALANLTTAPWAAVAAFVLLVFVLGTGIGQMRILRPPWTLLAGWCVAAVVWHAAARVVSGGESTGVESILFGAAVVLMPAAAGVLWRTIESYRRRRRKRDA